MKRKRILYICQYFNTPEEGGLLRPWEVSRYLVGLGYDVTVIAASPHHMSGDVDESLRKKLFRRFHVAGIDVVKVYSYNKYRDSIRSRILYYTIYPLLAFVAAMRVKRPDIIITSTPPIFLLATGYIASLIKRRKFIIEIRDAWLEFALARNLVPKKLVKPLMAFQTFMLKRADQIISVTPGIRKIVDSYTNEPDKNILVMNGYEEDVNAQVEGLDEKAQAFLAEHGLEGRFIAVYTGTMGMARDTDVFGRTAKHLRDHKDIVFLFVGAGEKKPELEAYCMEHALDNCVFLPLQPRTMMPVIIHASHVGLNSIRKNDALESSLSNKVFDYLGNGLPTIWAGEGDTSEFLEASGGGIVVEPENEKEMGEAILKLYNEPELRKAMGEQGREYVLENFKRSKVLKNLNAIL